MKTKDLCALPPRTRLRHRRYGLVELRKIVDPLGNGHFFGVVISPVQDQGQRQLAWDSGTDIPDFLEGFARNLKRLPPDDAPLCPP